jgi:hypothetical protein
MVMLETANPHRIGILGQDSIKRGRAQQEAFEVMRIGGQQIR